VGTINSVRLRLFVTDATNNPQGVYAVTDTTWTETGITFNNAPAIAGSPLVTVTPSSVNTYVDIDLPPSAVTAGALVTFGVKGSGSDSLIVSSRQATTNRPQLLINSLAPVGAFNADPASGVAPLTVNFTDQSSNGPTAWSWDFGDPASGASNSSTAQHPTHTFAAPGTYTVTMTPSNANGPGTPKSRVVAVSEPGGPGGAVFVGAGDIADCTRTQDDATANLLDGIPGLVFSAGDSVDPAGSAAAYADCYDPTWGRHKARTRPVAGNTDYGTPGAAGYFGYFGAVAGDPSQGWYSFDLGAWHVVMLNSNCAEVGGCGANNPQTVWLRADLAAHPAACTLAIFHHPRFHSRRNTPDGAYAQMWTALYSAGAEIVIGGHQHFYERFAPQSTSGAADPAFGIRQFVVGTGGHATVPFTANPPNSEVRNSSTHGVLKLTLNATSYDFSFVPIAGQTFTDSGSGTCHGAPPQGAQAAEAAVAEKEFRAWSLEQADRARRRS
jgi:hypothetical protein